MSANPYDFYRYLPVSKHDRDWGLYVTAAGSQTIGEGAHRDRHPPGYEYQWAKGRVFADQFGVLCLTEGGPYELESEGAGKCLVEAGDLFLLFPQVWHRYRCTTEARHVHVWATFGGSYAHQLRRRKIITPSHPVLKIKAHESVLLPYRRLLNLLKTNPRGLQQKLAACVLDILAAACAVDGADDDSDQFGDVVHPAISFLENHVDQEIDLGELAHTLHLSYDQFRHVFKQRTGLAPYQYHLQLRLNRAKELLVGSTMSVKQVAYALRFASPYHFSKIFKKKTGQSPVDWRALTSRRGKRRSSDRS